MYELWVTREGESWCIGQFDTLENAYKHKAEICDHMVGENAGYYTSMWVEAH